jgi:hypothetical protein
VLSNNKNYTLVRLLANIAVMCEMHSENKVKIFRYVSYLTKQKQNNALCCPLLALSTVNTLSHFRDTYCTHSATEVWHNINKAKVKEICLVFK